MQLVFSGPGRTADDLIRKQVEAARSRKGLCVVSSGQWRVWLYARSCGVEALKCHEFNRLLNEELVAVHRTREARRSGRKHQTLDAVFWGKRMRSSLREGRRQVANGNETGLLDSASHRFGATL